MNAPRSVAYLANLYPAPSHSFIRREIVALEAAGWQVHRFAHRRGAVACVDPADLAEQRRTVVLLDLPRREMLAAVCGWLVERPGALLGTLAMSLRMAWRGDGRCVAHVGYFVLACVLSRQLHALGHPHLHAHFGTNPAAVARLAQRLCGIRYSVTFHGPHEFAWPDRLNLDEKMAGARFVATVSAAGEEALRQRHPRHAAKLLRVRCGLDAAWWQRPPLPVPAACRLVCVARLDEQKNPLLLIDAVALAVSRGCAIELAIAGDGPLRAAVERRIDECGLAASVRLHGWCTGQQVAALLESSRALVLSSRDEGLPVAVMEAFACGRPAIAPDVGGMRELVETGRTGWLVRGGDVLALAGAMQDCLQATPAQLQALGGHARHRVRLHAVQASAAVLAAAFEGA
jgi:colanic acid/amylovoran biosynthesis glycosyltransferase